MNAYAFVMVLQDVSVHTCLLMPLQVFPLGLSSVISINYVNDECVHHSRVHYEVFPSQWQHGNILIYNTLMCFRIGNGDVPDYIVQGLPIPSWDNMYIFYNGS